MRDHRRDHSTLPYFFVLTYILFVPPLCFLCYSLSTSVRVQLVLRDDGPAYVCLGCENAFLRPRTRADEWRSAVRYGMVGDTTAWDWERQPQFAEGFSEYQ